MKKYLALFLALSMIFAIAACGKKSGAPAPAPTASPTAAPTPEPTPEATPVPTATPEPPPLVPDLPPVYDEDLSRILEATLSVQPGTAGSSLRAARVAAWLLDWGAVTKLTDDEIYSAVGTWLDAQSSERLQVFLESFLAVYDQSYNLRGENAEAIMSDAGIESSLYPWNERAARAVEMVSYGCGLR